MCSFSNINVPPPATVADLLVQSKNHSSNFRSIINVSTSIAVECNSRTTDFGVSHVPPKILRIRVKIFVASERVEACGRQREGNSYNRLLNEGARNHLYEISNKRFHRRRLDTIHAGPAIFQSIIERGANRRLLSHRLIVSWLPAGILFALILRSCFSRHSAHTSPKTTYIVSRNKLE